MDGYQINFYTLQSRRHQDQTVTEWLVDKAQLVGIMGATVIRGEESYGSDGRIHATRFFEQAEQPMIVLMVVTESQSDALFSMIKETELKIFYTRSRIESGYTCT